MFFANKQAVLLSVLMIATVSLADAPPTTRVNAYPWDTATAQAPPRARKAWLPCYHISQGRPDNTLRTHDKFIGDMRSQKPEVLFVGDSIIGNWRQGANGESWKQYLVPLNAYNLGVAGDMTEHILWRMENGELDGVKPKVVVLMAGTNNLWRDTPEDIAKGVSTIVDTIRAKTADSRVLVLGLLPRNDRETQIGFDKKINDVNDLLAKLADHDHVRYFSFGDKYLDQDGKIAKGFLSDGFHPSPRGYEVWATQVRPVLDEMLK